MYLNAVFLNISKMEREQRDSRECKITLNTERSRLLKGLFIPYFNMIFFFFIYFSLLLEVLCSKQIGFLFISVFLIDQRTILVIKSDKEIFRYRRLSIEKIQHRTHIPSGPYLLWANTFVKDSWQYLRCMPIIFIFKNIIIKWFYMNNDT